MMKASSADKDYVLVEHGFEYTAKDGTVVSINPNERYILLKKTNEHWWQVCQDYKSKPFYIPAKYVKVLSPFSQNCTGMARTGSEETMDVPSTEYSYKYVPARTDAHVQRSSIAVGAGTHSLCDISITREDLDERKFLPDQKDAGHTLVPLRTFQNSKKILDPLKRISYMCPPEFQPSIRPSQSLNDLQVIKSEPPVPNPRQPDVRGEMEKLSIQESHMAGAQGESPPEKVIKSEPPAPNPRQPDVRGKMEQLSIQQSNMAGAKGDSSPEKVITCEPPAPNPWQSDVRGKMEQLSIQESHMAGAKRDRSPGKVIKTESSVPNSQEQDAQGKLGQLFTQESHKAGAKEESTKKVIKSKSHVPNPYQPDIRSKMEPPSIQESHLAGAKGDLSLEKNYSGVSQASSEKTKDVPSSCNIQPAKADAIVNPQRFSIILCAETHSHSDVPVVKGDLAEQKPLLDKVDMGHTLGPLRTFHNSKKILDPLKRFSYMSPPEFQPSIKPSQSLNDLREIKYEPLVPSPCQTDVRNKMEPPSIQVSHVAEAKEGSPPKKNYSGVSQASSEKTKDVPSTEYGGNIQPAKAGANASPQRLSIILCAETHSLSDVPVVKEDPAERKPLLDKGDMGHTLGPLRTFHNSKKILDPLKRISYMSPPEFQPSIKPSQSLNDLREITFEPLVPSPCQTDVRRKMESPSIQVSHVAEAKGSSPPKKNYSRMSQASSEKMMAVASTEYKYDTLPAKTGTNANVQRFSIAQVADTHSFSEISEIREDPAKQKPLLDKRDPLKRIGCVFPHEFRPSVKLSKSLNDLQEIKPEPPLPNQCWLDVRSKKGPPSNQGSHVAGAKKNSSIEKVVNEEEESFYVNLEEFRKDKEKPRSSSQNLGSSSTLDDWETHTDQGSGQLFYYNSVTGETTWDCPFDQAEEQLISPASPSPAEEDSNWEKHFDETSGQFYFHNPVTGETSWDPPAQDDLHPSGGKPMFSPYGSMERRPPTPEADYPDSPQEDINYPETDYGGRYIPPPPYKAPSEEQLSGWAYHFKDGQRFYTNNYNGDTWVQSQDQDGNTFFCSPDGSVSQWTLPPLGSPELQRGHRDANQNSVPITGWRNNHPIYAPQKETTEVATELTQMKGLVKAGLLQKAKTAENGKRLRKNWSTSWTVLEGRILTFFKDAKNLSSNSLKQSSLMTSPEHTVKLQGASLSWASKEKSSKKHAMELKTQDGSEYLIHHDSDMLAGDWFIAIKKCIGKDTRMSSENTSENETESLQEFGSTEKLGMKDEKKGQNTDSDRNVRAKLRKFLLRRPTLQSLRDKGYIRDQVFGCYLHHLCEREKRSVPQFVCNAIQAVERRGLDIDGLYRVSGNLAIIQKLRHKVDQDENLNLEDGKWEDVHVITGALKLFFRELPEPLFPYSHFTDFVEAIKLSDQSQKQRRMKELVLSLPQPNLETMRLLFRHLCSVIEHRESNRMSVQSVAIVFGPTLLKPEEEGGNIAMYMVFQNQIVEHVLLQYKNIFS
ncbi:rho GTPase-activating protein 27-like isoform X6 [Rana temporaria]|uniref:rho GTPase-activating protein 27-like isoform X6 n=1 Tax=Rana temporaria TaxID=8407 RepID=UPI001AAD77CF|nr:rho GTPase-activating protein 27-like isoform X6 [Rana temporaria]